MPAVSALQTLKVACFYLLAALCVLAALATTLNLGFILTRGNSVSVINVLVGQFVMIVALLVLGKWLYDSARRATRRQPPDQ